MTSPCAVMASLASHEATIERNELLDAIETEQRIKFIKELTSDAELFDECFFNSDYVLNLKKGLIGEALLDVVNNNDCSKLKAILNQMIEFEVN